MRRAGYSMVARSLRGTYRRIVCLGPFAPPPPGVPVVLYANHHLFHDSYVLGFLAERVLRRRTMVWMEAYDRFPFFGALGAMPMPPGDALRRMATIRRTARIMARQPDSLLIYYPEGRLHPADEGIAPFPRRRVARLASVLPPVLWWPVALAATGLHQARPTILVTAGTPHAAADGGERDRLIRLLERLRSPRAEGTVLLEGVRGLDERWDFSRTARRA